MTLFRTEHNKNYTIINNTICKDARISWKAKGIWLYAFSRPDDWQFYFKDIVNQSTDGPDAVRSGLKELEQFGYLQRSRKRDKEGKMAEAVWVFYELPQLIENPSTGEFEPIGENPTLDNPVLDNPTLPNTEAIPITESNNKQQQQGCLVGVGSFDFLDCWNLTEQDKVNIMRYDPNRVRLAIEYAKHVTPKKDYVSLLIWHCQKIIAPPIPAIKAPEESKIDDIIQQQQTAEQTRQGNIEIAERYYQAHKDENNRIGTAYWPKGNDFIISSGGQTEKIYIYSTASVFENQLISALRKLGLWNPYA